MQPKKSYLPWIILIVLILVGFGIYAVTKIRSKQPTEQPQPVTETPTTEPETQEENLTNLDPSTFDAQLKENLDLATALALKWRADAALVYVEVQLDSVTPDEGTETYVFDSPKTPGLHFTCSISQKTKKYIRAAVPTEDYLGSDLLAIDIQYWKINYVSALQIAEKEGGKEFREKNLNWTISIKLQRGEPKNWLYYTVEYKTKEEQVFSVKINPSSSEVVEE